MLRRFDNGVRPLTWCAGYSEEEAGTATWTVGGRERAGGVPWRRVGKKAGKAGVRKTREEERLGRLRGQLRGGGEGGRGHRGGGA